jgi:hypothetical protein
MAAREGVTQEEAELRQRGLLFTGEVINRLTVGQLAKLGELAGSFGGELRIIDDVQQLGRVALTDAETAEFEPIVFTREDFRTFAIERGIAASIATRAWWWVANSASNHLRNKVNDLPTIDMVGPGVDLRSLYAHVAHQVRAGSLPAKEKRDRFLLTLLDEVLQPKVPLSRPSEPRKPRIK